MKEKLKILTIFVGCLLFRLLPLRAPNVEPITASIIPISKRFGYLSAFFFGFLSIFIYDLITNFGPWTFTTALAYGVVGVFSYIYFKKFKGSALNTIGFVFIVTIAYDLFTGVLFAPMWGMSIFTAFMMQIPFTALHLAGNISFIFFLSPVIEKWLVKDYVFSVKEILKFNFKN